MQVYGQKNSNQLLNTIFWSTVKVRSQMRRWTPLFNCQIRRRCQKYHESLIWSNSQGPKFRIWDELIHCPNSNKHLNTLFNLNHKYVLKPLISILLKINSSTPYLKNSRGPKIIMWHKLKGTHPNKNFTNAKKYDCHWI